MLTDVNTRKIFVLLSACSGEDERLKAMLMEELEASPNYKCVLERDSYFYISEKAKVLKKRLDEFKDSLNSVSQVYEGEITLRELKAAFNSLSKSSPGFSFPEALKNGFFVDVIYKDHMAMYMERLKKATTEKLLNCVNTKDFKKLNRPEWDSYENMLEYYGNLCDTYEEAKNHVITNLTSNNVCDAFEKPIVTELESWDRYKKIVLTNNPENDINEMVGKNKYYCIQIADYQEVVLQLKESRVIKARCCFCNKGLGLIDRYKYTTCKQHRHMEEYSNRR